MFPSPTLDYVVLVVVPTYNHREYISDTLKGIVMQQTNFPFVACILDDCSTDGTADIVRRYEAQYPDVIKEFYFDENQYSQGKFTYEVLIPWLGKVKYIALCEGDDYWIDPLKLQKQVDFMEGHSECNMSFHSVTEHWQDGSVPDKVFFPVEDRIYTGTEIFKQWVVATCSVMIRTSVFKNPQFLDMFKNKNLMYYDQAIFMYCSINGGIQGMHDVMGVYRRLSSGYTIQLDDNLKQSFRMIERYCTHLQEMENIFGSQLDEDFQEETKNRLISNSLNGCLLAMKHKNLKYTRKFFSLAVNKSGTIDAVFSLSKIFFNILFRN